MHSPQFEGDHQGEQFHSTTLSVRLLGREVVLFLHRNYKLWHLPAEALAVVIFKQCYSSFVSLNT